MKIIETPLIGCYTIEPNIFDDNRGTFIKTYHKNIFQEHNLNTTWSEEYFSTSHKNVIRGMHFQLPPHAHEKLVYCVAGSVLDVIVDLRINSATYGKSFSIELSPQNKKILYISKGFAHGFKACTDNTLMMYKVSTIYEQKSDTGILWDSCNIDWHLNENMPIISNRDMEFTKFKEFKTPF